MDDNLINGKSLAYYLRNPIALKEVARDEIETEINRFPYSSHLHLILTIKEYLETGIVNAELLERTALYISDRKKLGAWVNRLQSVRKHRDAYGEDQMNSLSQSRERHEEHQELDVLESQHEEEVERTDLPDIDYSRESFPEDSDLHDDTSAAERSDVVETEMDAKQEEDDRSEVDQPEQPQDGDEESSWEETLQDEILERSEPLEVDEELENLLREADKEAAESEFRAEVTNDETAEGEDIEDHEGTVESTVLSDSEHHSSDDWFEGEELAADDWQEDDTEQDDKATLESEETLMEPGDQLDPDAGDVEKPVVLQEEDLSGEVGDPKREIPQSEAQTDVVTGASTDEFEQDSGSNGVNNLAIVPKGRISQDEDDSEQEDIEPLVPEDHDDPFINWLQKLDKKISNRYLDSETVTEEKKEKATKKKKKKKKKKNKKKKKKKAWKKSFQPDEAIVSEALAELLATQGHYEKAIEMYQKLRLIIPEKSIFFAQKIEELGKKS